MPQKTAPSSAPSAKYSVNDFLKDVNNIRVRSDPGIDYDPRIVDDNFRAMAGRLGRGVSGLVSSRNPTIMFLSESQGDSTVVPHEMEHLLQLRVDNRDPKGKGYDRQVLDEIERGTVRPVTDLVNSLKKAGTSKDLADHLQKLGGGKIKPAIYLGGMSDGEYSLREQYAELSAWEQALRKDLTKDPVVRREFFNDDENLIRAYKGTAGLRTDRLDAKDLPPMTANPAPSMMDQVRGILKNLGM